MKATTRRLENFTAHVSTAAIPILTRTNGRSTWRPAPTSSLSQSRSLRLLPTLMMTLRKSTRIFRMIHFGFTLFYSLHFFSSIWFFHFVIFLFLLFLLFFYFCFLLFLFLFLFRLSFFISLFPFSFFISHFLLFLSTEFPTWKVTTSETTLCCRVPIMASCFGGTRRTL